MNQIFNFAVIHITPVHVLCFPAGIFRRYRVAAFYVNMADNRISFFGPFTLTNLTYGLSLCKEFAAAQPL